VLELQGICAGYGGAPVLRDVDLVVPPGAVVALLGANGAGKTTLLRVASGLLAPTSGRLLVDGQDVTGRRPHALTASGVCHVPEGRGIFRGLSVRDNIALQAPDGDVEGAVERAVASFPRLGERLDQLAGTMSGGEQQMLALARALANEPAMLMLDEISMGLAPRIVAELYELVGGIAAQGVSILVVEQFARTVLEVADYAAIMTQGKIRRFGEPADIADDLSSAYLGGAA
jgi:branched-chain amino acid transport system ATP-binding protein